MSRITRNCLSDDLFGDETTICWKRQLAVTRENTEGAANLSSIVQENFVLASTRFDAL